MRGRLAIAAILGCAACSFDLNGFGELADSGADDRTLADRTLNDGDLDAAADSAPCPEDIHLVLRVNGASKTAASSPSKVLLGDTVQIDANGSCSRLGPLSYTWTTTPAGSAILPDGHAPVITALASEPMTYLVKLRLDAGAQSKSLEVPGYAATGFTELVVPAGASTVTGLASGDVAGIGTNSLWMASTGGAFVSRAVDIVPPAAPWSDVLTGGEFTGPTLAARFVRSVALLPSGKRVFYGSGDPSTDEIMVLDVSSPAMVVRSVVHLTAQMQGPFQTFRLSPKGAMGMWAATSRGLTSTDDFGATWSNRVTPGGDTSIEAVLETGSASPVAFAGSDDLYNLTGSTMQSLTIGDDMVKDLVFDAAHGVLWVATGGSGVIGLDRSGTTLPLPTLLALKIGAFDMPSDTVRAIALDPDGDLWMATAGGIARFKRDRNVVLKFLAPAGVTDLNVLAVAVEPPSSASKRPRIFFGTNLKGVLALEVR